MTSGSPHDLDDETLRRVARSFYLVRMVRYALLLLALAGLLAGSIVSRAPRGVAIAIGLSLAAVLGVVVRTRVGFLSAQRPPSGGPSSRSPTG